MKIIFTISFLSFFAFVNATIINVPADQLTIQEGINVAVDGDTVLVQPGTYLENINYNGKLITVASLFLTTQDTTYISQTIIDGDSLDSVVKFESGEDSTAVLCGLIITNGSSYCGGGIYCHNSSPSLENITISDNWAEHGGGIYCWDNSCPSLVNVVITVNTSNIGGGILCDNSSPILKNVTISSNNALYGGGVFCWSSNPSLMNVIISNNSANVYGGGISCENNSSPSLVNVTITGNSANHGGGIFCWDNSNPELLNCIMWNNSPEEIYFSIYGNPNSITISYSDIQGGESGIVTNNNGTVNWLEGNIEEDTLFIGTGEDPYSLLENSPCIDAGILDTTGLNLPPWDIIGNHRIWDGDENGSAIIDMGAYEYGAPPYVDIDDNVIIQTSEVSLLQNYPNPFNPSTTISFSIPQASSLVNLEIYNIKGQKIRQYSISNNQSSITWNGTDQNDQPVSSGIYLYKLSVDGKTEAVKKCLLLK